MRGRCTYIASEGLTVTAVFARLIGEFLMFLKVERTRNEAVCHLVNVGVPASAIQGLVLEKLNIVYLV
jgi:hypothetical protein